jgi:Uma2 family endonuclease
MDRVEKRDFYLDAGVPEYWIVDADARMVERWTPARETPEVLRGRLMWAPPGASTPLALELPGIFDAVARKLALIGR